MMKQDYLVLGVMSGTSLDGIDLALLSFERKKAWSYRIIKAETVPYPKEWQLSLEKAITFDEEELTRFNGKYTRFLAEIISNFIIKNHIGKLDAICSHGHTIKHEPENGFTLQIGNQPDLAKLTGQKVICDFRVQDVQLGGQGAPLVPVGDELLFSEYEYCLNLGGFANISTNINGQRIAFDICPVNTVLNYLANKLQRSYDKNGEIAASGAMDEELLEKLNSMEYYFKEPPKSLGVEWINEHLLPLFADKRDVASLLHTFVVHVAVQISRSLDQKPSSRVLTTGGGAFNSFLIREIEARTKNQIIIPLPEVVDYKEALIFGFLGVLRMRNEINVLSSVTGASKNHSSGKIYTP